VEQISGLKVKVIENDDDDDDESKSYVRPLLGALNNSHERASDTL